MTTLYCPMAEDADYHSVKAAFQPTPEEMVCETHGCRMSTFKPRRSSLSAGGEIATPRRKQLQRGAPLRRVSKKREGQVRRQGSTLKKGRGFAVVPAQRAKVEGLPCVFCGREASDYVAIDPAHLWPRGKGGCDDALCVIPLCRDINGGCHRPYDAGELDLVAKLVDRGYFAEVAHAIEAHSLSPLTLLERLTGQEWMPVESRQPLEAAAVAPERSTA